MRNEMAKWREADLFGEKVNLLEMADGIML